MLAQGGKQLMPHFAPCVYQHFLRQNVGLCCMFGWEHGSRCISPCDSLTICSWECQWMSQRLTAHNDPDMVKQLQCCSVSVKLQIRWRKQTRIEQKGGNHHRVKQLPRLNTMVNTVEYHALPSSIWGYQGLWYGLLCIQRLASCHARQWYRACWNQAVTVLTATFKLEVTWADSFSQGTQKASADWLWSLDKSTDAHLPH